MTGPFLLSGDICGLARLEPHVWHDWNVKDIVTPTEGGEKSGRHRRYDVMTAVGVVVAVRIYRSEHGCVLGFVKQLVKAFSEMTEAELERNFKKGKTHFATLHQGKPILQTPPEHPIDVMPNVAHAVAEVRAKLAEMEADEAAAVRG